jgi:hypothetical protein
MNKSAHVLSQNSAGKPEENSENRKPGKKILIESKWDKLPMI